VNHWPFIWSAYAATAIGTIGVVIQSWAAMRRAEQAVADQDDDR
jgi:heme exporter protein CcmD